MWLEQAQKNSEEDSKDWNGVAALNALLKDTARALPRLQHCNTRRNSQEDERNLNRIERDLGKRLQDIEGIRHRLEANVEHDGAMTEISKF